MLHRALLAVALGVATTAAVAAAANAGAVGRSGKAPGPGDRVARGRYLVQLGGCNDCHTPWKRDAELGVMVSDTTRLLSGHPAAAEDPASAFAPPDMLVADATMTGFRLAFGTVYAANLTPDRDTGLGTWTEDLFIRTMRTGRHLGAGRPILPPMPWFSLRGLTDDDLRAVFAYLRSIPPVHNPVPDPKVAPEVLAHLADAAAGMERREQSAAR